MKEQIKRLSQGTIPVALVRPCTAGDGIALLSDLDRDDLTAAYEQARAAGRVTKMVPASGAATRMFKELLAALAELETGTSSSTPTRDALHRLESGLSHFAFAADLQARLAANGHYDLREAVVHDPRKVLAVMLRDEGLGLANLPKAMVPFHLYADGPRLALEEHLHEAIDTGTDAEGVTRVHFTIADDAMEAAKTAVNRAKERLAPAGVRFEITFSIQDPLSDTVAIDGRGEVVRNPDGSVHKRPAGHGALLENLGALAGDIVTIKNIDNVVPDHLKPVANGHRAVLGGLLVRLQEKMFGFLRTMDAGEPDTAAAVEMLEFAGGILGAADVPRASDHTPEQVVAYLRQRFDRPLRVCGVVPNTGEPGGGPFWTEDPANPKQIVESASVALADPDQNRIWNSSTHFNPVDLVCGLRNYQDRDFELSRYVDPDTALVVDKSLHGVSIRALELPGLWNGAMARWNSVFVEVPLVSFNPVKTVFDLLRDTHQPFRLRTPPPDGVTLRSVSSENNR